MGDLEDALLSRYPTVLFAHNYYGTCMTGTKCNSFPQARPCERQFGPKCLALHYPLRCGGLNPLTTLRLFQKQSRRQRGLRHYKAVLVASEHMYQEYLRHGLTPEQVNLVPLPITDVPRDPQPPKPRTAAGRILLIG